MQATFTGKEYDEENSLQYFGARYYDNEIGKLLSIDPAVLILHDDGKLREITNTELEYILDDPQRLNSYSYALNNPVILIDENGEFVGPFGRDLASGQRQIASFLHRAAEHTSNQGGFLNKVSGFVTEGVGDFVGNMADVFDPDQGGGTRMLAFGLVALDSSTGGEGKAITQSLKNLPRAFTASKKLNNLSKMFGKSINSILNDATEKGVRYVDNAHKGNVNILTPKPGKSSDFIRVTLDPTQQKVISAGHVRQSSLNKYLNSGRFTPID